MNLVALGAIATILSTIAAAFVSLWVTKINARSKRDEAKVAKDKAGNDAAAFGQTVLMDGVAFIRQQVVELQKDVEREHGLRVRAEELLEKCRERNRGLIRAIRTLRRSPTEPINIEELEEDA